MKEEQGYLNSNARQRAGNLSFDHILVLHNGREVIAADGKGVKYNGERIDGHQQRCVAVGVHFPGRGDDQQHEADGKHHLQSESGADNHLKGSLLPGFFAYLNGVKPEDGKRLEEEHITDDIVHQAILLRPKVAGYYDAHEQAT